MLIQSRGNNEFEKYMESRNDEVICMNNINANNMIKKIILENIESSHEASLDHVMSDIHFYNMRIFEDLAQKGFEFGEFDLDEYENMTDGIIDMSEDINQWYFVEDELTELENLIYDTAKEFDLPIFMTADQVFEYPTFVRRFSMANSYLDYLSKEKKIKINAFHAQTVMFDDLFEDYGSCFYGRENILLINEDHEKAKDYRLMEGYDNEQR